MNRYPIYCSTGTIIGRLCNYDHKYICSLLPSVVRETKIDGIELMMLPAFYDKLPEIARDLEKTGLDFPVIHAEKNIGILFSEGGKENIREGMRLFDINCKMGRDIGASRLVFHLWGGFLSDAEIDRHIELCPELFEIADRHSIEILFENIPCSTNFPLDNLKAIYDKHPRAKMLFDTRFGEFHHQFDALFSSDWLWEGALSHIHISDLRAGEDRDFTRLRPREGLIDFPNFFAGLKAHDYRGSVTLESPVLSESGIDTEKLTDTLIYIRDLINA